jgi:hypothetical protein
VFAIRAEAEPGANHFRIPNARSVLNDIDRSLHAQLNGFMKYIRYRFKVDELFMVIVPADRNLIQTGTCKGAQAFRRIVLLAAEIGAGHHARREAARLRGADRRHKVLA